MTEAQKEWARCRPWLKRAVERSGFYTIEYAEAEIEAGDMHFWPGERGAVLTRFVEYPKGKALVLFAIGGARNASLDELLEKIQPRIDAFAETNGCRWVIGNGRKGWEKVSKKHGYKVQWLVLVREVI